MSSHPPSHGQVTADGAQGAGVQTYSWENDLEGFLPAIKLCGSELWLQPELPLKGAHTGLLPTDTGKVALL